MIALVVAADALHPTIVPVLVVSAVALGLMGMLLVGIVKVGSPPPGEVAIAFELAWDRFEFDVLYDLSGPLMRDGRARPAFVADKRAAYAAHPELQGLVTAVRVQDVEVEDDRARVTTRLELRDGGELANDLLLRRDDGTWRVEGYHLDRESVARHGEHPGA